MDPRVEVDYEVAHNLGKEKKFEEKEKRRVEREERKQKKRGKREKMKEEGSWKYLRKGNAKSKNEMG